MSGSELTVSQELPALGFVGWGAESRLVWEVLSNRFPGLENSAQLYLPGISVERVPAAEPMPAVKPLPTVEALFSVSQIIFIGGEPEELEPVLPLMRLAVSDRHILVLMGHNWSMEALLRQLHERKLVRCLVSPLPGAGSSLIAFHPAPYLATEDLQTFRRLFSHLELLLEVPSEAQFRVVLGLAGFAPAAFYTIMDAIADGALMMGLSRPFALKFVATLLAGAAQNLLEEGAHPALLREQALEYEVAVAGVLELESAGIRGLMMRAVQRAIKQAAPPAGRPAAEDAD